MYTLNALYYKEQLILTILPYCISFKPI